MSRRKRRRAARGRAAAKQSAKNQSAPLPPPRPRLLGPQLRQGITWLLAKRQPVWAFVIRWKKRLWAAGAVLSAIAGSFAYFVTALSITPGEPRSADPFTAPFVITNQRSLLSLMDVSPDCDVHHVEFKDHPDARFDYNHMGIYRKPVPVLAPGEEDALYCGRNSAPLDMGQISFADVTVSVFYRLPLHLPCYGMKWQRFMTYVDSEGKLKWKPVAFSEEPIPQSIVHRRRFGCW
jgi:hypothetical protein